MEVNGCDECEIRGVELIQCLDCTEDVYNFCSLCIDAHVHEIYSDCGDYETDYDSYDSSWDYATSCDEGDYETTCEES